MSGGGGYGVWVDSFAEGVFDVRSVEHDVVKLVYTERTLRVVLIAGPDLTAVLAEYTRLAGRPRQPPGWVLAPWKGRDVHRSRHDILHDVEKTRELVSEGVRETERGVRQGGGLQRVKPNPNAVL
jgi:alpha-glucosidase (family GH31 glycosyl hydrolase)